MNQTTTWALTAEAHRELLERARGVTPEQKAAFEGRVRVVEEALATKDGRQLDEKSKIEIRDGSAILKVKGSLSRNEDFWSWYFGGSSYERLARDFTTALESPAVRSIVFDFDSPGGEVNSCNELGDIIYAARGKKPIIAVVGGMAASGAYWLASACDQIVCTETAQLGSIGVIAVYVDYSKMDEKFGIVEIPIISSQSPYKRSAPTTKDGKARIQARIDELAEVFVSSVARNRRVSVETVLEKYGKGDLLVGASAISAGLADQFGTLETTLALLAGRPSTYQPARLAAAEEKPMAMKCSDCGAKISDDDEMYCGGCYKAEAEAKAMGLESSATGSQRIARATALAKFEADVLAATGAPTIAAALGKIAAGVEAHADLAKLRESTEKTIAEGRAKDFVTAINAALSAKPARLTLGQLCRVVPTLLDDKKASLEALAKVEKQEGPALVRALAELPVSAAALERVSAFIAEQGPQLPQTVIEPSPSVDNQGRVIAVTDAQAKSMGMTIERAQQLLGAKSVADVIEKKQ